MTTRADVLDIYNNLGTALDLLDCSATPSVERWLWPVGATPEVDCIFTSNFWVQRSPTYYHEGVDIRARNARPILAVANGVIARASLWDGTLFRWDAYGNHVLLSVDYTDYCVLFAHMRELRVVTGQRVQRGAIIGISGATGNVDAEHLHLHVTHPTGRNAVFSQLVVDPAPLLPPLGQRSNNQVEYG